MELGETIFQITINFPADEKFNLIKQIRRAVDSIALLISEGEILQSKPELKNLLVILFDLVQRW